MSKPSPIDALEVRKPEVEETPIEDIMFPNGYEPPPPGKRGGTIGLPSAVQELKDKLGSSEKTVRNRYRAQAILTLRAQFKWSRRDIARAFGMTENAVKVALWRARSGGLLNDLRDILEHDVAANAIDRVNAVIQDRKNPRGDDHAIRTLEGLGHFRNYSHQKNEGAAGTSLPPLQVNVVIQQGAQPLPGQPALDHSEAAVGTPREDT